MDSGSYTDSYNPDRDILCLDFANTLNWRTSDQPHDWLDSYSNLVGWGQAMDLLGEKEAGRLRKFATQSPQTALEVLQRAITLREAIYNLLSAYSAGMPLKEADLNALNPELLIASQHRALACTDDGCNWRWDDDPQKLDRMLWPVAQSAADLLASEILDRVGECQGEGCGWLFLDTSKNKTRRWCSMDDCGNREKARKFYRRKKKKLEAT